MVTLKMLYSTLFIVIFFCLQASVVLDVEFPCVNQLPAEIWFGNHIYHTEIIWVLLVLLEQEDPVNTEAKLQLKLRLKLFFGYELNKVIMD